MKFLVFAAVVLAVCAYANGDECCGGLPTRKVKVCEEAVCDNDNGDECCGGLPRRKVKVCEDHNREIKVIHSGHPCECQKALPYKIEVPVVEKQILRKHKYAIEKTTQPKPKPRYIYNARVEKPVNTQEVQYEGLRTAIDRIILPAPDCPQPCDKPEPESAEVCCHKCKKTKESCGCRNVIVKVKSCKKCQESSEETGCGCEERSIESCGCNKPHESSEEICQKSSEETCRKIEYSAEEIDCGCSKCQKPKKTCGCGKIYSSEESDCGCGKYEECKKIKYSSEEIDCGCKRCQEPEEESEECKKIRYSSEEIDCGCRKCQQPAAKKVCGCNRRPVSSGEGCGKIVEDSSEEISCGCQVRHRPCEEKKGRCEESEEQICTKDSVEVGNCGCSKCTQKKHECESEEESEEQCGCGNKKRVHVKYGKFYRYLDKNYGALENNNNSPFNNEEMLTSNSNMNSYLHSNNNLRYNNRMKRHLDNIQNINQLSEEDSQCNQLKRTKREFFIGDMQDCSIVSEPKPQYEIDSIFKEIKESEKQSLLHNADIFSESDSDSYNSASDSAENASTLKYSTEDIIDITANTEAVDFNNFSSTESISNVNVDSTTDFPFILNVTDDSISTESLMPRTDDLFTTELPVIDSDISDITTETLPSETTQDSDDQYDDSVETGLFDNSTPIYNTESSLSIENFENDSFDENISTTSETESTEISTIAETMPTENNFFKLFLGSGTNENENMTLSETTTENTSGITLDVVDSDENIDSTTERFEQNTEITESTTQLPVSKITTEVDSKLNTQNIDITTTKPSTTFNNPNFKFVESTKSNIDLTSSTVPNLLSSSTIPNLEVTVSTQSPQDSSTTVANKTRRKKGEKKRSKTKRKNTENREKRSIDDYYFKENQNIGHKFKSNQKFCACCTIQNLIRYPKYDRSQLVCSGCLQFLPEIQPKIDSNRDVSTSIYKTGNSYDTNYKKYKPSYYNLNRRQHFIPKYGYDTSNYNTNKRTNIHYPMHKNYNSDCVKHKYSYPDFKYENNFQKKNKYQLKDSVDTFDKYYTPRCPTILKLMEKNKYNNAYFDQASLPQYLPEIFSQPKHSNIENSYYVSHTENCNPLFYKPRQRRHTFKYNEEEDIPVKVSNIRSKSSQKSTKHREQESTKYNFQPANHNVKKSDHKLKPVEKFEDHRKPQLYYKYLSLMAPKKRKFGYVRQENDESSQDVEYTNLKNRNLKDVAKQIEDSEESSEYDDTSEEHIIESNDSELIDDDKIEEKNKDALSKIHKDLEADKYCPCGCGMLKSECPCCQKSGKHSKCCNCPNCKLHTSKSDSLDLHSHPNFENNRRHYNRNERNSKHTDNLNIHKLNLLSDKCDVKKTFTKTENSRKSEFSTENLLQNTEDVDSNSKIVYDHLGHKYIEHDGFRKLIKPKFDIFDEDFERSSKSRPCIRDVIDVKDFNTEDSASQQNVDENIKAKQEDQAEEDQAEEDQAEEDQAEEDQAEEDQAEEEEEENNNNNTETQVMQVTTKENVQKNMAKDNAKETVEILTKTTIESVHTSTDGKDDISILKQNGEYQSTTSVSTTNPKSITTQISTTNNLETSDTIIAEDGNTKSDFYKNLLEHVLQKTELCDKYKTEKLKLENLFKTDLKKNPNFPNCDAYIKFITTKLNLNNSTKLSPELTNSIDSIISNNHTLEHFITLMRFKQKFDEEYANFESTTDSKVKDDLYKRMLENVFQNSELYDNYKNYLILKNEFDNLKKKLRFVDYSIQEFFNNCKSLLDEKSDGSSTENIESNIHYSSTPKTNTEYYTKKIEVYPIYK